MRQIVLSHFQARQMLEARRQEQPRAPISADLNKTTTVVTLAEEGVRFPPDHLLTWEAVEHIAETPQVCFRLEGGEPIKIQTFCEETQQMVSLMPTAGAPTVVIAGFPMHRIKETDPYRDTLEKIRAAAPLGERVLDTTTGLGYTAIEAAHQADEVITIEVAPVVLEIARCNPWSQELFTHPRIQQIVGDCCEEIEHFADQTFDCIIHDPPTFSLAGDLYSGAFYRQLHRVLRPGGRLFHYVGDLKSRSGSGVVRGVMRRLQEAGFRYVRPHPQAFGVVARR